MNGTTAYTPPTVWSWNKESGGRFANINRPIAGATHEKDLPVGRHPLQLYSLATPNGVKVTVMLEELLALGHAGAEYDAWLIRISEGDQFGSGFVAVNPNSKIPALLDRSGATPIRVFESGAILQYLAEKFGSPDPEAELVVRPSEPGFSQYLNWLFHADATLTFPQTILLRYREQEPDQGLQTAGEDYGKWYIARLRMLDATLEDGREFLVADRFTLADVCITYALFLGTTLGLDERYKPQTKAYLERMMARPA